MEQIKDNKFKIIIGAIVVVVLIISATIYMSAGGFSEQGSYVDVKGLSEKIVKSDTAIWSMSFSVKSNDIDSLYSNIESSIATIKNFLKEKGFDDSEINIAPVNIYQNNYKESTYRFDSSNHISVYTKKVDLAKSASNSTLLLVKKGIVLEQNYITFQISDLNSIKPAMLSEAIKNARATASQFAKNTDSNVGGVTRGNQGVFEIEDKDPGSPEYKKVRLVSTLRFLIK